MKDDIPTRSICRFIAILKVINRSGPVSLLGIAKEIDIPYPTVSRVIQTLLKSDLIERVPDTKCYRVAARTLELSNGFAEPDRLIVAAREPIAGFTAQFGWPIAVATRVGSSMVVRDSTHHLTSLSFSRCPAGFALPLLESASGHVHLAFTSDAERECILDGLEMLGGRSPMLSMFRSGKPVQRIREDGHATYERGQRSLNPGKTSSISVPVLEGERLAGTVTLVFFASAMPMAEALRRFLPDLSATAARIAESLSASFASLPMDVATDVPSEDTAPRPAGIVPRRTSIDRPAVRCADRAVAVGR